MLVRGAEADTRAIRAALATLDSVHTYSEVAMSPDGRRIVYGEIIMTGSGNARKSVSTLWITDSREGSRPVRLTACPDSECDEHGAAWSPDGTRIAFVTTNRIGQPQVAVAADTGRALILTDAHGPLDTPRWSPDGSRIAFLYSEGAPRTPGPLHPLAPTGGAISTVEYEQRLATVPARGGRITVLSPSDLNVYEYDWSPDGKRFVVTAAHGSGDDNWWVAELDLLDSDTRSVVTLVRSPPQMASPRWSSDGVHIAYIGGIMSDEGVTGGDVYVISAEGGPPTDVTPGLAASVNTVAWRAPTRIMATEFAAGEEVLAMVDTRTKSQRQLWRGPEMIWANSLLGFTPGDAGIALDRDGKNSAVIRQSFVSPPEIETGPPGRWRPIRRTNAAVHAITGSVTNVHWESGSFSVQGMLIAPRSIAPHRLYPLVVEVHGGPAYAHYPLFPTSAHCTGAILASEGYFVFRPNPRGSYGQGEAFTQANVKDFGRGDLADVLSGLDFVEATRPIDRHRVGITGWSYGGYMTMWAVTRTSRFKAAVAGAGISDWESYYGTNNIDTWMVPYFGASLYDDPRLYDQSSPLTFIRNARAPVLLLSGDRDAEVPVTQSYEYWNALRRLGVRTELVVYPGEGHVFFRRADQLDALSRLAGWFDTYLKAGS